MKIYDLSLTFEPKEKAQALGVDIKYSGHEEGVTAMQPFFGCAKEDLPGGLGWAGETLTLSTHDGTHVDAPWHYAPVSEGKKARTIDEMPIERFYGNGVVIDMQHKPRGAAVTSADLKAALKKIKYTLKPGDIVLPADGRGQVLGHS